MGWQDAPVVNGGGTGAAWESAPVVGQSGRYITPDAFAKLPPQVQANFQNAGIEVRDGPGTMPLDFGANPNDRGSMLDTFAQGTTFGWGDELRGLVQGGMSAMQGGDFEMARQFTEGEARNRIDNFRADNPLQALGSEIAGAIPTSILAGGNLIGGSTLGARALTGGAVGLGQGAYYGAGAADGDMGDRAIGALFGGAVGAGMGAAAPYVGNWVSNVLRNRAQRGVLSKAARDLVGSGEVRNAASQAFKDVDAAGAAITPQRYISMLDDINGMFTRMRAHPSLDPKAIGALDVLRQVGDELAQGGVQGVPISDLHTLRQIAQKAAMSSEGRDAMFANAIVNKIDEMASGLRPTDMVGGGEQTGRLLLDGIEAWNKANKIGVIESAIEKARNQASGFENGLRVQFRSILNNRKLSARFNEAELEAIREVVRGTNTANLMKLMGKFGFDFGNSSNMLGGSIAGLGSTALTGNPLVGLATMGAGSLARKQSEQLTSNAANRALAAVSMSNLGLPPLPNQAIPAIPETVMRRLSIPMTGQVVN